MRGDNALPSIDATSGSARVRERTRSRRGGRRNPSPAGPPPERAAQDRSAAGGTPHGQFGAALRAEATVGPVVVMTGQTAHWVNLIGSPPHCPSNRHSAGTNTGAPFSLIKTTTNFAGLVLLAFRPTT